MKNHVHLLAFLCALCVFACKDNNSTNLNQNESAQSYFTAYTSGLIFDDQNLILRHHKKHQISEQLKEGVSIIPAIEFDIHYDSLKGDIIINPVRNLERNQSYQISIDLNTWFGPEATGKFTYDIETFAQTFDVRREGLILDENNTGKTKILVFSGLTESTSNVENMFEVEKEMIEVRELTPKKFEVYIKNEKRPRTIKWSGKSISSEDQGEIVLYTFDPDLFEVVNSSYDQISRQYKIYFSQLLDETQDATGLITINDIDAEFDIDDNVVTVYLKSGLNDVIEVLVSKSLKSKTNIALLNPLTFSVEVETIKPEIEWLEEGTYIPHTGEFKVPFKAKGLKSVHVQIVGIPSENAVHFASWNQLSNIDFQELKRFGRLEIDQSFELTSNLEAAQSWAEYGLDFSQLFRREKGKVYTIILSFGPENTVLECIDESLIEVHSKPFTESFFDLPNQNYYYYDGYYSRYGSGYSYRERENPCHITYYYERSGILKNIHCTNIFPITKKSGDGVIVAVKELLANKAAQGATVELFNLQGLLIEKLTTSSEGFAQFRNPKSEPQALRISYNEETSYFNLHEQYRLPLTEFDVSSDVSDADNRIFAYTEREIWRPGDTIFLDVMINKGKFSFEDGLPIQVALYNAKGILVKKLKQSVDQQSIYSFKLNTSLDDPTGFWRAEIKVGPHKKIKSLRVETIKPNVVDINYSFNNSSDNWIYDSKITGELNVDYLAGYPMQNGRVQTSASMISVANPFSKHSGYRFFEPRNAINSNVPSLIDVKTNESGSATINSSYNFKELKAVSRVILDSKIDLPGGGLNTTTRTYYVSPYSSYVGIDQTGGRGWGGSFSYNEKVNIKLVHVNKKGELLSGTTTAKVHVYRYKKDWWYDRYRLTRNHSYREEDRLEELYSENVKFKDGTAIFELKSSEYESGAYLIKVIDQESGHMSSYNFHCVTSASYAARVNPHLLEINTDKDSYSTGEDIVLDLPQLQDARALISIEVGDKIHDIFWTDFNTQKLKIKVEDHWTPNVFLNVHVVQNYGQTNNNRPMRMYAVRKIKINRKDSGLAVELKSPNKVEPNSNFSLTVRESRGKSIDYTIAVVDVGLLNITGFQTPDPEDHFNKLIALRIQTWDIYSELIKFMNPSFAGILSIGGDGAIKKLLDESADFNRFVPVVRHLGPFHLEAGKTADHKIQIPNYIGQLRLMVVASGQDDFGNAEKHIRVVSPLMVQSQLPRALNVSDTFSLPVTLFKDEASIKNINLSFNGKNGLLSFNNKNTDVSIEGDQKVTDVRATVGKNAGTEEIEIKASSGKYKSEEKTKIFINYPNSYSHKSEYIVLKPKEEISLPVSTFGFPSTQHLDLNISGLIMPDIVSMYQDLIQYPHGCLEQTTSKGFAQLFIDDIVPLTPEERIRQQDYISAAILKILSYRNRNGAFNYWPNGYYHPWADLYAAFFLQLAKEKGHNVSDAVLSQWASKTIETANAWRLTGEMSNIYYKAREEALQAFRLFVLARSGHAQKGAMNRFRKENTVNPVATILLAGAYGHAGLDDVAKDLVEIASTQMGSEKTYPSYWYWGGPIRNKAIYISIAKQWAPELISDLYYRSWVKEVDQRRWLNTHEKGFIFMATSTYLSGSGKMSRELDFEITSEKHSQRVKNASSKSNRYSWLPGELNGDATIVNHGESELYIHRVEQAISTDLYPAAGNQSVRLVVSYSNLAGNSISPTGLGQGDEIKIQARVINDSGVDLDDLALTVKAPSGWELINPRIFETAESGKKEYNYQDFKDDRAYTYFNLAKSGSKSFNFSCRAQLKGNFYLPAVSVVDMYDLDVFAHNRSSRVTVK